MHPFRLLLFALAFASTGFAQDEQPQVFAHYMPWFESKPVTGNWGYHWTMNHFDPDTVRWNGKREVAANDYPLLGLYDSSDPAVLECHVLQMKMAGIDGVMIDWYGTRDFYDYAMLHENTAKLIPVLKRAGLKFAICYEDQTIGHMKLGVDHGKEVMKWLDENWFVDDAYLKIEDRPVLLVFGPQHFKTKESWNELFADLSTRPKFYTLPYMKSATGADGSFAWPPVTEKKTHSTADWTASLEKDHADIAVAFPGFADVYTKAGVGESHGRIAHQNGKTMVDSLDFAFESGAELIQIATWNDFGEGTQIEPTHNLGYRHLDAIQARLGGSGDVHLPAMLYDLRKNLGENADLDRAADLLFESKIAEAKTLLEKLRAEPLEIPGTKYKIAKDILYREGDDYMKRRCRLDVYFPADGKPYKTVVWFHGGGLQNGHRTVPTPLLDKGIAVVTANYRFSPRIETPVFIEDAAAAVAWTVRNIENFGGSADSVFVSGHSAGGYLAAMIGLDKKWLAAHEIDPDDLAGLIPFSGHTITHFTIRKERGIAGHQPILDEFAPLFHIRKDAPPMLLITGDRELELWGRYEENAYFWRMMEVVGHPKTELRELEGFDHGGMPEPGFPLLLKFMEKHGK